MLGVNLWLFLFALFEEIVWAFTSAKIIHLYLKAWSNLLPELFVFLPLPVIMSCVRRAKMNCFENCFTLDDSLQT